MQRIVQFSDATANRSQKNSRSVAKLTRQDRASMDIICLAAFRIVRSMSSQSCFYLDGHVIEFPSLITEMALGADHMLLLDGSSHTSIHFCRNRYVAIFR